MATTTCLLAVLPTKGKQSERVSAYRLKQRHARETSTEQAFIRELGLRSSTCALADGIHLCAYTSMRDRHRALECGVLTIPHDIFTWSNRRHIQKTKTLQRFSLQQGRQPLTPHSFRLHVWIMPGACRHGRGTHPHTIHVEAENGNFPSFPQNTPTSTKPSSSRSSGGCGRDLETKPFRRHTYPQATRYLVAATATALH